MRVPLSWLKAYVPVSLSPRELAHHLTMAGNEVGEVDQTGANWDRDKVLVGQVLRVEPHPNADRLSLPTVDLGGGEPVTVVCGAPNVATGQKIAFAREGARLLNARTGKVEELRAADIRGVRSEGMVCSVLELGIGEDHEGILVLDDDAPVGAPLVDYLGDAVLDIEVTPNRPDCLSILGVAHEAAALMGAQVTEPDLSYPEEGAPIEDQVGIEIADPDLCGRYTASLITGVKTGPSPRWLQDALTKAGQRPISNVVDITNYVMLEYGQPLHAFDFGKVKDQKIIVRAARPGEHLVTLDGEDRTLQPPMLTIADSTDAVGLAGIMGGANTEIDESTTMVLLESASFDMTNTRRTRTALRLDTEASRRFERGIRAELAPRALRRATKLFLELAGGTAARGIIDLYPGRKEPPVVRLSRARIRKVLGVDYPTSRLEEVLTSLGFEQAPAPSGIIDAMEAVEAAPIPERDDVLWLKAPYWRSDISIEDDLVEEIARIIGYDTIPTTMLSASIPHQEPDSYRAFRENVKDLLAASGMQETISYSLTNMELLDKADARVAGPEPMKIANPISGEFQYLRTSLTASVLATLSHNRRLSQGTGIRIFEIGRVYLARPEAKERELPDEREMLVGVVSGPRHVTSWMVPRGNMDFYDAKGVLEAVLAEVGIDPTFQRAEHPIMIPGRTAQVVAGGVAIGKVGEVRPEVLERFDLEGLPAAMFELDMGTLTSAATGAGRRYQPASRYPESYRDLALIVADDVTSDGVQAIINRHRFVVHSAPFDVYSGDGVPAGKKSIAYRIAFRSDQGTLTSEQVDRAQSEILRQLERSVGAELRG